MSGISKPQNIIQFCPKCGDKRFPLINEKSFKCKACGFHFFINSAAAVAALIFNDKDELLFTKRAIEPNRGKLDLPGGFVDPDESAEEALTRELEEELSIKTVSIKYFDSFPNEYLFSGMTVYTLDLAFIVNVFSLSGLKPKDDISGIKFIKPELVDFNELPAKSMQYFIKKIIRQNEYH